MINLLTSVVSETQLDYTNITFITTEAIEYIYINANETYRHNYLQQTIDNDVNVKMFLNHFNLVYSPTHSSNTHT